MNQRRAQKWIIAVILIVSALLVLSPMALAYEARSGVNIVIGPNEVIEDDLFVSADQFILRGTVKGDLIVVGTTIQIEGIVEGDLMAAGQSVAINGEVKDDVRIAGALLTMGPGAQIGDDVMAAGYALTTQGGQVGGDLIFAGGQAAVDGSITRDLKVAAVGLELRGSVGRNVSADVGSPEDTPIFTPFMFMPDMPALPPLRGGLTLGPEAHIGGDLDYVAAQDISIEPGVVSGRVRREEPPVQVSVEEVKEATRVVSPISAILFWFFGQLRRLITLLLVGLVAVLVFPTFTDRSARLLQAKPLPALGWGVVTLAAIFAACLIILIITIVLSIVFGLLTLGSLVGLIVGIGLLALGALGIASSIAISYVSKIVVSYLIGRLILGAAKIDQPWDRILAALLGILIFVVITVVPILGGLITLVVVLFGLGALWLFGMERWPKRQLPAAPEA